jgi:hypothetical protein
MSLCARVMMSTVAIWFFIGTANAQVAYLGTGGAPTGEGSNYHEGYGPALEDALNPLLTAMLYPELELRPSNGTGANIKTCAGETKDICFGLAQGDSSPTYEEVISGKVIIVRSDLPAECGFAFASNPAINNWRTVQKYIARVTFYLPPDSGTADYFNNLVKVDPAFQDAKPKIEWVTGGSKAILAAVAKDNRGVGLAVTFPNPTGGTIKTAHDADFTIFGAASPAMRQLKHEDGNPMYTVNAKVPYSLAWLGLGETQTTVSMCTPAVVVATNPDSLTDALVKEDMGTLIRQIRRLPASAFSPQRGRLADLFKKVNEMSASVGLDKALTEIEESTANFVKELE